MTTATDIVLVENDNWLVPVAKVEHAIARYEQMKAFVKGVMSKGTDYDIIPGTSKDTLLKPGAEKLATFFGLRPMFEDIITIEDWTGEDHNGEAFFYYRQKCNLYRGDAKIGDADGSCNSWEKKYRYRQAERVCPQCNQPAIRRSKYPPRNAPSGTPGWYCHAKAGGCGDQFVYTAPDIVNQEQGLVPNPNVADMANTVLKMAQKRAFVAAVLITTNASEYFTQDVEDISFGNGTEVVATTYRVVEPTKPNNSEQKTEPGNNVNGKQTKLLEQEQGTDAEKPSKVSFTAYYSRLAPEAGLSEEQAKEWAKLSHFKADYAAARLPVAAAAIIVGLDLPTAYQTLKECDRDIQKAVEKINAMVGE